MQEPQRKQNGRSRKNYPHFSLKIDFAGAPEGSLNKSKRLDIACYLLESLLKEMARLEIVSKDNAEDMRYIINDYMCTMENGGFCSESSLIFPCNDECASL